MSFCWRFWGGGMVVVPPARAGLQGGGPWDLSNSIAEREWKDSTSSGFIDADGNVLIQPGEWDEVCTQNDLWTSELI